jgi:hypothetical protein
MAWVVVIEFQLPLSWSIEIWTLELVVGAALVTGMSSIMDAAVSIKAMLGR